LIQIDKTCGSIFIDDNDRIVPTEDRSDILEGKIASLGHKINDEKHFSLSDINELRKILFISEITIETPIQFSIDNIENTICKNLWRDTEPSNFIQDKIKFIDNNIDKSIFISKDSMIFEKNLLKSNKNIWNSEKDNCIKRVNMNKNICAIKDKMEDKGKKYLIL
jgi:hypothetical protein